MEKDSGFLSDFDPGDTLRLKEIVGDSVLTNRLMELGLIEGTILRIVKRAPLGEPIEIKFRGSHLALRLDDVATLHVEKVID